MKPKILLLNPPGKYLYVRDYFCSKISKADYINAPIDLVMISGVLNTGEFDLKVIDAVAEKKAGLAAEELEGAFRVIHHANERMISLVNDLLDVNRIEDHKFQLAPAVFSLNELSDELVKDSESSASSRQLKFITLTPKSQFWVKADQTRIKSVISRFIDNAIRYSTASGELTVTLEDVGWGVKWSITDQGAGISAQEARQIFSKFFRASNILRYQTEGLGVGLYLSKYIIEASGGTVGFRTLEGHGSTFFFTLPKAKT